MTLMSLRDRWEQPLLVKTNNEIARFAKSKRSMLDSPFGTTSDGRMDYRGFTLAVPILYSIINQADFTGLKCDWAGCLTDCILTNSLFASAVFDGRFLTKKFEFCDFTKASLKNSPMGDSNYSDCEFSVANLSAAMARGAVFNRCNFTKANFKPLLSG
jgi:uncharacterized protein YjbI with pentapeptide repeats